MSQLYHQFPAFTIDGLTQGALYALVAFGFTIVYRILRLFNFAHGGVFMVGTFVVLVIVRDLDPAGTASGLGAAGVVLAMVGGGVAVATLSSLALDLAVYRPIRIRQGGGLAALIAGLGIVYVLEEAVAQWKGRDQVAMPQPIRGTSVFSVFGASVRPTQLLVVLVVLATFAVVGGYISQSRLGRALRAVAQDRDTASLVGIDPQRVILLAFALAGVTVGIAAALSDVYFGSTSYFIGFGIGIKGLTAALLGGMGSVPGALAGGVVLGLAESYGGAIFASQWQDVIAFAVLVLVLVVRPTGIAGERIGIVRA